MANFNLDAILARVQTNNTTLETVGKVVDFVGAKGELKHNPANVAKVEVKVQLTAVRADGKVIPMVCSNAVSDDLRSKALKLSQVLTLPVVIGKASNDEEFLLITYGRGELANGVKAEEAVEFTREASYNPEQFLAL